MSLSWSLYVKKPRISRIDSNFLNTETRRYRELYDNYMGIICKKKPRISRIDSNFLNTETRRYREICASVLKRFVNEKDFP